MTKSIRVAGHKFDLTVGRRYLATRPMAGVSRHRETFDVTITDITDGFSYHATPAARVPGLSYAAANDLLDAFNNGESSFEGRLIA
jgi:hypothetical protein